MNLKLKKKLKVARKMLRQIHNNIEMCGLYGKVGIGNVLEEPEQNKQNRKDENIPKQEQHRNNILI